MIDYPLKGYRIRALVEESTATMVYRAEREHDGRAVVLKLLKREAATPDAVARYRRELEMLESLRGISGGVVQALGLETAHGLPMLVLEDIGAESLARLRRAQRLGLEEVLALGARIADILGEIHARGVLHRDVNPSNILVRRDTRAVMLTDFGSSVRSAVDPTRPGNTAALAGTLAYMAPEQTGRMDHPVDHRADLYSLGVTLYELCTGRLPFDTSDAVELVHSHIARQPVPAHEVDPNIPEAVSAVISRLMAKMPADRYQSAHGCAHDLRACQSQLQATGRVQPFALAEHDVPERFVISDRLYGREREQAALRAAVARALAGGRELLLLTGHPGIGKSALARELAAPATRGPAYFIEGKFDQYQRNVPYSAVASAFGELLGQLLTEPEERLGRWRAALGAALGSNGQVLVDVIPDLTFLIGPQPPVARLGPAEAENRFHVVFQRFLEAVCSAEHPLLLFLDDLQWADAASLRLVQRMATDPAIHHLLILGAYRDHEAGDDLDAAHPLMLLLEQLRARAVEVERLALGPLGVEHVRELLAVALQRAPDDCTELAELVLARTEGNPFFVDQLLRTLHQERLLAFDRGLGGWRWDLGAIRALGITDDVVDLMIERIRKLPAASQRVLELAACAGNVFDTGTLAVICEDDPAAIQGHLVPAIELGLVRPLPAPAPRSIDGGAGAHAFAHDRVQQAAYALIAAEERGRVHLRIARLLAHGLAPAQREQRLFELAEHFVLGAPLLDDPAEKLMVARLCLAAGQRAQASMARDTALRFLRAGLALVPAPGWQAHYELTRDLTMAAAEAAYLTDQPDEAVRLSEEILAHARDVRDKAAVHQFRIILAHIQGRVSEIVPGTLAALAMLGIVLPREPAAQQALEQELHARLALDDAGFAALERLPAVADPQQSILITRLLPRLFSVITTIDPAVWRLMAATAVVQAMEEGHSAAAAMGHATYGMIICGQRQDFDRGLRFGELAMRLIERFPEPALAVKVECSVRFAVLPWSRPLRESLEPFRALTQRGLQLGDLQYACFAFIQRCLFRFVLGDPLDDVHREQLACLALIERHGLPTVRETASHWERVVRRLLDPAGFASEPEAPRPAASMFHELHQRCTETILRYIAGEHEAALAAAVAGARCAPVVGGFLWFAEQTFWHSLAILAALPAEPERAGALLGAVERNQALLGRWAARVPENFRHQHLLVEAESARARGDALAAMPLYDQAIDSAGDSGHLREEAIANERAAGFYAGLGRTKIARGYLTDAYHAYRRWGAQAKVRRLEEQHPWLARRQVRANDRETVSTPSSSGTSQMLDVASVVRASQAISGQLVLDALLAELMKIIIENAGAERGYLLLMHGGTLALEAEGEAGSGSYRALPSLDLDPSGGALALTAVSYVARTRKSLVLHDAAEQEPFAGDPYVRGHRPRSLLCAPIARHGDLVGAVYLENNLMAGAFTPARVEVVQMLASQAAISLENARLLDTLRLSKEEAERAREEAERARAEAERANRAKSDFLASVNHELRTPMNGIIGMLELLLGTSLQAEQADYLVTARTAAEQLMRIIRDTLDLSRIEAGRLELEPIPFTLADALATLERMLVQRVQARGLTFERAVAPDVPAHLVGDRDRLLQALINLLGNAIKFTPVGGRVSLRVRVLDRSVEHTLLGFDVRDTGIGIAAADQAHIFQPFTQARAPGAPFGGSGLGLAITSELVALMGGAITVESAPGAGSCFSFTARFGLWQPEEPAQPVVTGGAAPGSPVAAGAPARGLRILVVEDNEINQRVAVRLLGLDGHSCAVAANGLEALLMLEAEPFDAVLMDVVMPVMDGREATRELRRREQRTGRHLPVIALTASATTDIVAMCEAAGMDHFLSKPLRREVIRDLLRPIQQRLPAAGPRSG
jgi:predicted ATPase/signal transduction histidine kinase/CheY-like chemotaxis protein